MGIGFSGLLSFLLQSILLICIEEDKKFDRVLIYFSICFILMTCVASIYFLERKNEYANYFIKLSTEYLKI